MKIYVFFCTLLIILIYAHIIYKTRYISMHVFVSYYLLKLFHLYYIFSYKNVLNLYLRKYVTIFTVRDGIVQYVYIHTYMYVCMYVRNIFSTFYIYR